MLAYAQKRRDFIKVKLEKANWIEINTQPYPFSPTLVSIFTSRYNWMSKQNFNVNTEMANE